MLPVRLTAGQLQTLVLNGGQFRWSFKTKAAAIKPEAPKPRATAISGPWDKRAPFLNLVEITFDQPMRPTEEGLPFLETSAFQGPYLIPSIAYDSA
jgi:hypothetical protein